MTANGRSKRTIIIGGAPLPDVIDEGMIRCVVHGFYAEIRRDELLGPIFRDRIEPNDWPRHLAKICDFWSATLLRSSRYEGRPLPPHLAISGLGEAHFRRWLKLFRATVRRICPPEVAALFMDRALRIAHSFRLAVAFSRGETTMGLEPIAEKTCDAGVACAWRL
ncbi:MAG: group III truncated hemoglobin [Mesorhizobium sp.]|uniref:group III truncated hemoglobin n=1 Tax=Mesorhizobium sp. TaxID=1871066 RepID=UPI0007EC82D2|nr:group III truncated hemoglobin [Mesorhizobium sp.]RWE60534.1 MAG: group III truncated hemoglobin [Mesorhizobium sp.]RWE69284.1 MAG: group III truncated hemoglobin [Mesorhizobium sp.]TIU23382.1 MAG: group III truncated hemoglobin [Mesorhizobium sp.]TIX96210.1 MAG: group III truncated hemoglobin [Mesorhizobium sp.]